MKHLTKKKTERRFIFKPARLIFAAGDADECLCGTRPDEDVELFALHLHVVLFLVQLILQPRVDLHQFVAAQLLWLGLMKEVDSKNRLQNKMKEVKKCDIKVSF